MFVMSCHNNVCSCLHFGHNDGLSGKNVANTYCTTSPMTMVKTTIRRKLDHVMRDGRVCLFLIYIYNVQFGGDCFYFFLNFPLKESFHRERKKGDVTTKMACLSPLVDTRTDYCFMYNVDCVLFTIMGGDAIILCWQSLKNQTHSTAYSLPLPTLYHCLLSTTAYSLSPPTLYHHLLSITAYSLSPPTLYHHLLSTTAYCLPPSP